MGAVKCIYHNTLLSLFFKEKHFYRNFLFACMRDVARLNQGLFIENKKTTFAPKGSNLVELKK